MNMYRLLEENIHGFFLGKNVILEVTPVSPLTYYR
jgi:hypothetical protein